MTCIVAVVENGIVYMGADSAGVSGYSLSTRKDPKIYKVGKMLIGFTSSFRMGQILGYKLKAPIHYDDTSIEEYMNTVFIDTIREVLKDNGYSTVNNNSESGGIFLVGYKGRIFKINSDFQVGESVQSYDATGCGEDIALGSLFTSFAKSVEDRLRLALEAAETFSSGVRQPFIFKNT